jgi:hypothetical protein
MTLMVRYLLPAERAKVARKIVWLDSVRMHAHGIRMLYEIRVSF